jgi:hypothetical protein
MGIGQESSGARREVITMKEAITFLLLMALFAVYVETRPPVIREKEIIKEVIKPVEVVKEVVREIPKPVKVVKWKTRIVYRNNYGCGCY